MTQETKQKIRTKPHGQVDFLEHYEIKMLFGAVNRDTLTGLRNHAFLLLIVNTGRRREEIIRMNVGDIFFEQKNIIVERVKQRKKKKKDEIPLDEKTLEILKGYIKQWHGDIEENKNRPLFETLAGNRITANKVDKFIKRYVQMAGIKKRIASHSFRATKATLELDRGTPPPVVRDLLGQSSLAITSLYARSSKERLRKAQEKPLVSL